MYVHLRVNDLSLDWFIADLYHPESPDYDVSIHDAQIRELLSKPTELVKWEPSEKLIATLEQLEKTNKANL